MKKIINIVLILVLLTSLSYSQENNALSPIFDIFSRQTGLYPVLIPDTHNDEDCCTTTCIPVTECFVDPRSGGGHIIAMGNWTKYYLNGQQQTNFTIFISGFFKRQDGTYGSAGYDNFYGQLNTFYIRGNTLQLPQQNGFEDNDSIYIKVVLSNGCLVDNVKVTWRVRSPNSQPFDADGLYHGNGRYAYSSLEKIEVFTCDTLPSPPPPIPTCSDGIQNQGETQVDCGGPCPPCPVLETCNDGIQNQNETGIDCGGVCPPCNNQPCTPCHDTIMLLNMDGCLQKFFIPDSNPNCTEQ